MYIILINLYPLLLFMLQINISTNICTYIRNKIMKIHNLSLYFNVTCVNVTCEKQRLFSEQ